MSSPVTSGGISGPDDLHPEQTPATWLDFASMGGDHGATALYENAPVGNNPWSAEAGVGKVETSIYNAVQNLTLQAFLNIAADFAMPVKDVMAIANGFIFLAAQGAADHYNYDSGPAINYLLTVVANNTQVLGLTPPSGDTPAVV